MTTTAKTRTSLLAAAIAAVWMLAPVSHAQASGSTPDIAGTYQCKPDPRPCSTWPGSSPSISQSGDKIEIKNDKGEIADGMLTSDITMVASGPLNSLGIVRHNHSIDWSDGTTWRKK